MVTQPHIVVNRVNLLFDVLLMGEVLVVVSFVDTMKVLLSTSSPLPRSLSCVGLQQWGIAVSFWMFNYTP